MNTLRTLTLAIDSEPMTEEQVKAKFKDDQDLVLKVYKTADSPYRWGLTVRFPENAPTSGAGARFAGFILHVLGTPPLTLCAWNDSAEGSA
jgi:hypothetical protein